MFHQAVRSSRRVFHAAAIIACACLFRAAPADAAPNGASEFDPTYQPSQPAQPAPAPAAPGSDEFF